MTRFKQFLQNKGFLLESDYDTLPTAEGLENVIADSENATISGYHVSAGWTHWHFCNDGVHAFAFCQDSDLWQKVSLYEYVAGDWRMLGPSDDWSNAEVLAEFWPHGSKYPDYIKGTFLLDPESGTETSISALIRKGDLAGEFYARETVLDLVQDGVIEKA